MHFDSTPRCVFARVHLPRMLRATEDQDENASVKVMIEVHNQNILTVMMVYGFNEKD